MRGCFCDGGRGEEDCSVLPAYAGMFPEIQTLAAALKGSPRVCGDVSANYQAAEDRSKFSPRMRGCFLATAPAASAHPVLPAYAGMFLCI